MIHETRMPLIIFQSKAVYGGEDFVKVPSKDWICGVLQTRTRCLLPNHRSTRRNSCRCNEISGLVLRTEKKRRSTINNFCWCLWRWCSWRWCSVACHYLGGLGVSAIVALVPCKIIFWGWNCTRLLFTLCLRYNT